ncbi:MAG: peptidase M23 [Sulfurimonas sp. RIFOXYD12_FULL_33_39]|uniref:M23 family metallopeptidase n=1 Tax=unclassified Sulfurimonas TaxID=2623549 RepID=UPI0008D40732|nr:MULTISPECIES: M23 family metallopeptidase [unclassified Sulfurimonas]OHE01149.1 MAG: peptidase M23 [Sulfurimonas sp. RIFCSPLOWO2_12_FULL_34_6]OHE09590.1 MAG: peptidase M23 [Sulfurimonas sp. RIFOXYD12_FULL_33_39]OHE13904.1 MAG: peptidase M23 [Sulfurimonas sp. RIFOXYD2_FULL_34_21]
MRLFSLLMLFTCTLFSFNVDISDSTISNGKTALFEFEKEKNIDYEKIVSENKTYKIFKNPIDDKKYYALLPISYYEKPSKKEVGIFYKEAATQKSKSFFVHVEDGKYEKETLKVDGSKVTLNEKDKKRASIEYEEAMKIYNMSTPKSYITSSFIVPLKSKITSDFGKARVYNGSLKGYHSGTDFRADIGTPLLACNDGKIVLAKDRFYSGGSVLIDHGHGVYSCYFHMSKFNVKNGSIVKKGEVIGLSGKSGRVTGPHLHFSFRVGGEQVDPLQFIELMNKKLLKGI